MDVVIQVWHKLCSVPVPRDSPDLKCRLSTSTVIDRFFHCVDALPHKYKVELLNCIYSLTRANDLTNLCETNCAVYLINTLNGLVRSDTPHEEFREIQSLVIRSLHGIAKSRPTIWDQMAQRGMYAHCRRMIDTQTETDIAPVMLCDMICHAKSQRKEFLADGVTYLLRLLELETCQQYAVNILTALLRWLECKDVKESAQVADILVQAESLNAFAKTLTTASAKDYFAIIECYSRICYDERIADAMSERSTFLVDLIERVNSSQQVAVRLNLLKILTRVFECTMHPRKLLTSHVQLCNVVEVLVDDSSPLVRAKVRALLDGFVSVGKVGGVLAGPHTGKKISTLVASCHW
eukprot:TRINITY_DN60764_c0_g2_i1.p1 TRINITY_DN60764_c0_g2~~TRINITY_DN60764_c0_g2_i1.p1  ORF type:complete len:394 (+),score=21.22 TRINITY_DN60764_c0_g2_i1:131-1183(+)